MKNPFKAFKLWHYKQVNSLASYLHDRYLTVLHFIYETERVKLVKSKKAGLRSDKIEISLKEVIFRFLILIALAWIGSQKVEVYNILKWTACIILPGLIALPIYYLLENNSYREDSDIFAKRLVYIKLFITGSFYNHHEYKSSILTKFVLYMAMVIVGIALCFLSILTNKSLKVLFYKFATRGLEEEKEQVLFEVTTNRTNDLDQIDEKIRQFTFDQLGYKKKNKKAQKAPYLKKKDYPKAKIIAEKIASNSDVSTKGEFWNRLYPLINKSKEIDNKKINSESTLRKNKPFFKYIKGVVQEIN